MKNNSNKFINVLDLIELENGYQPEKRYHIYKYNSNYIRFIQNRDYNNDNNITYIPISNKNHLCSETDIMMDKYGEAGKIRYGLSGAFNVALLKIIPKEKFLKEFLRDFFSQKEIEKYLFNSSQASTRASLNKTNFINLKLPFIDNETLKNYENKINKILLLELKINNKIKDFSKIKDILLKKYFN